MAQPVSLAQVADLAAQLPPEERRQLAVRLLDELSTSRPATMSTNCAEVLPFEPTNAAR